MTCDRCGTEARAITGSYFDTAMICPECRELEHAHPQYEEARRVENEHVRRGEMNFPGIGLPDDLKPERKR